jgi:antitoxin (DNA-binding transcriptional repressor) of toxin-antitoxin stability system
MRMIKVSHLRRRLFETLDEVKASGETLAITRLGRTVATLAPALPRATGADALSELRGLPQELREAALARRSRIVEAERLARDLDVDPGVAEHTLAALEVAPARRLAEGLALGRRFR